MNKTLKFSSDLVPLVLSGEKTTTWRLWDDKSLKGGDIITFIKRPESKPFAVAKVTSVIKKPMAQLTEKDKTGHEKFSSDGKMYATYSKYYDRPVGPDTLVKVVRFELIEKIKDSRNSN